MRETNFIGGVRWVWVVTFGQGGGPGPGPRWSSLLGFARSAHAESMGEPHVHGFSDLKPARRAGLADGSLLLHYERYGEGVVQVVGGIDGVDGDGVSACRSAGVAAASSAAGATASATSGQSRNQREEEQCGDEP